MGSHRAIHRLKIVRFLLSLLLLAAILAAILVVASFSPLVQTWAARMALKHRPGIYGSLDSISAGFGEVDVTDLHLEVNGAVLTLPSLEAKVPLTTSVWDRKVVIRSLDAEGWTLDLGGRSKGEGASAKVALMPGGGPGPAQTETIPAQTVDRVFRGILSGWKLPCDVSLDGVDLEGDVLVPAPGGGEPAKIHVIIKGGGMAVGSEGVFTVEAAVTNDGLRISGLAANGSLIVAMGSPRVVSRMEIKADLSANGESLWGDLPLSADIAAFRGAGEETYTLGLSRGGRQVATALAHFPETARKLRGSWKVDLRESDLAAFFRDHPLPQLVITGAGRFDAEAPFTRIHSTGGLTVAASDLGVLASPLGRLGAVGLEAQFDLTHSGRVVRVDHLTASVGGGQKGVAAVRSLQAFDLDERTGDLKLADPHGDWLEVSIQGFPLASFSNLIGGLAFAGNCTGGEFVVRTANGAFSLRPKAALTAAGVSVERAGQILGRDLDLSLLLGADCSAQGWHVQCAPLVLSSAGRRLATVEAKASWITGEDQPVDVDGTWNTDLDALASNPGIAGARWIEGRAASGDFSLKLGSSTDIEAKLTVLGHDPDHSVTAGVSADVYADGEVSFLAPVKVAFGSSVSDVSAEGTRTRGDDGPRIDVKLTGGNVALDHLRLLATPLALLGGGRVAGAEGRDRIPFWGNWVGHATVAFDRLSAGDADFNGVDATVDVDHGSLRLKGGGGRRPQKAMATGEGSISFDPAAKFPYDLKAVATINPVDAATLFGAPQPGQDPVIEGRFSVVRTLTGKGANLDDLAAFTHEEDQVTSASTGGIIRLLKPGAFQAVTDVATPVSDSVKTAGSFLVGVVFGVKKDFSNAGTNKVSKTTEAVLNFADQVSEFNYDQIAVTAIRGYDRTLHLVKMEMTAADEHLTGSGQITYVEGLPLSAQPLHVDLQLGVRNGMADLLSTSGLLSSHKDELGYTLLNQPIRFGGTLAHIDPSAWRDLLVKAATRKLDSEKSPK